jgi:hypothetical protein
MAKKLILSKKLIFIKIIFGIIFFFAINFACYADFLDARASTVRIIFTTLLFFHLASCGGGGDVSDGGDYTLPSYGAIAVSTANGSAGIAGNNSSQSEANKNAVNACGAGCTTVLEYGSYKCGALARAANTITFGWSSNSKKSDAESNAVLLCTQKNGVGCAVVLSECNES